MSLYNFQAHSYIRRSDHTKVLAMLIFGLRANKHTYVRAHMNTDVYIHHKFFSVSTLLPLRWRQHERDSRIITVPTEKASVNIHSHRRKRERGCTARTYRNFTGHRCKSLEHVEQRFNFFHTFLHVWIVDTNLSSFGLFHEQSRRC